MRMRRRNICVFIETGEDFTAKVSSLMLLSHARILADRNRGKLTAVIIGGHQDETILLSEKCGADEVLILNDSEKKSSSDALWHAGRYAGILAGALRDEYLLAVLFAASPVTKNLAPAYAVLSGAVYHADCQDVMAYAKNGQIVFTRNAFGGAVTAKSVSSKDAVQVGLIRTDNYVIADPVPESHQVWRRKRIEIAGDHLVRLIGAEKKKLSDDLDITEADVIVSGGRGAAGKAGFELIRQLADCLGGAVGASRVAVDNGWIGKDHLIGQSGRTVRPRLYINCGVSGSIQHITGMSEAGCVVSINTDPKALIFNVSDYALVGDMYTVLPMLIRELNKKRDYV